MPASRKSTRKHPTLSLRDQDLIRRFLDFHREGFLKAFLAARAGREAAPGLTQFAGMMSHRKNQISGVDYMLSHLPDRLAFLSEHPDYTDKETAP